MTKTAEIPPAAVAAFRCGLVTKLLGFAAGGAALQALTACAGETRESEPTSGALDSAGRTLVQQDFTFASSVATLRATPGKQGAVAVLGGYAAPGDGGGGVFTWSSTVGKDDDGTILNAAGYGATAAGWRRIHDGIIDVKWFGAKGDGIAEDQDAIQRAIAAATEISLSYQSDSRDNPAAPPQGTYPKIVFPAGSYVVVQTLNALSPKNFLRALGLENGNLMSGTTVPIRHVQRRHGEYAARSVQLLLLRDRTEVRLELQHTHAALP